MKFRWSPDLWSISTADMPILKMKPHRLEVFQDAQGYEDENGDFHAGTPSWIDYICCDAVPAGRASSIATPDGKEEIYSYVLYLPKECREFKLGERVRVSFFENGQSIDKKEFTVKGFHAYQHQCKMWL